MSSTSIRLEKVCLYCQNTFIAQKVSTKYCSHKCNQRHYKVRKREEKTKRAAKEDRKRVKKLKLPNYDRQKTFSIREVCILTGVSRITLYRWMKKDIIKSSKIGGRVFISKKEVKKVFQL